MLQNLIKMKVTFKNPIFKDEPIDGIIIVFPISIESLNEVIDKQIHVVVSGSTENPNRRDNELVEKVFKNVLHRLVTNNYKEKDDGDYGIFFGSDYPLTESHNDFISFEEIAGYKIEI